MKLSAHTWERTNKGGHTYKWVVMDLIENSFMIYLKSSSI
jgi:hypothetical protein